MLHKRHLRSIYDDEKPFFKELLEIDSSVSIHDRNLRALAIEMHKYIMVLHQLSWMKYSH